jgi:hypothetical protein
MELHAQNDPLPPGSAEYLRGRTNVRAELGERFGRCGDDSMAVRA